MELADDGDLLRKVKRTKEQVTYIREEEVWSIFLQILRGLAVLHQYNVVHRDLKVVLA